MSKDRCRNLIQTILKTTLTILLLVVSSWWDTTFCFPEVKLPENRDLNWYCLDIANRLNDLGYLSVTPEQFASFIWKVSYCESGHKVKAKGKDSAGSLGLWQMSKETRQRLKVRHGGIEVQAENYFKFLVNAGIKLRWIKGSVDLHCYNFTPANFRKDTLSRVTNPQLEALDLNKDSVITRQDIILFQKKRLKA